MCVLGLFWPSLLADGFEQTDVPELLRQGNLGYSFVRLLPKDTGVRPIVNLRGSKSGQSVRLCCFT